MAFRDMAVNLGAKIVCFKFGENVTSSQLDLESLATQRYKNYTPARSASARAAGSLRLSVADGALVF